MNEILHLRMVIGEVWRADPKRVAAERGRIKKVRRADPAHFANYRHLMEKQWYKGGPISMGDLADLLGVGIRSVNRWEAGDSVPTQLARKAIDSLMEAVGGSGRG